MITKVAPFLSLLPASMILTASFFVMFTVSKITTRGLRVFGGVVVAVLWIAAVTVVSTGIYVSSKCSSMRKAFKCGKYPHMKYHKMMKEPMMK